MVMIMVKSYFFIGNKKELVNNILLLTSLFFLFFFMYRNLRISSMWSFGDLISFPIDVKITEKWVLYVWNGEGLGLPSSATFNYYLTILLFSLFFGGSLAQKIMLLFVPIVSFLAFFFFLRKSHVSWMASVLGALAYSLNPIIITEFVGGSLIFLTIYSVFPIISYYIIQIIQDQRFDSKNAIILGLLGFVIYNMHVAFWYIIALIPLLWVMRSKNLGFKRIIIRLIIPLTICILVLFPNIIWYVEAYGINKPDYIFFESDAAFCYKDSALYNLVRLAGNKGSAQAEEFLNYNTTNAFNVVGYALIIVGSLSFLNKNQVHENKKRLVICLGLVLILYFGLILVIKAFPFIVDSNPILASLRNPAKLMYPLSFSLCFLFAIGVEVLSELGKTHNSRRNFSIGFSLLIILLLYNYPALDGTMGLDKVRYNRYYVEDRYQTLPRILQEIDENYDDYIFLLLPWEYETLLKVRSLMPNYFGYSVGAGMYCNVEWLKNAFEVMATTNSDKSCFLGLFGVKYILVDKNFRSSNEGQEWYEQLIKNRSYAIYESCNSYWIVGEPDYFFQVFNLDPDFELIYENSDFCIFENKRVMTKMYRASYLTNLTLTHTPISENLIKNPSFENDTEHWNIWPGNLSNIIYDSNRESKVIALYGEEKRFTVCYQAIPADENTLYTLEFLVKGYNITDMHAKVLWHNLTENLAESDALFVDYIKLSQMDLENDKWYKIEKTSNAPKTARMATIEFLGNHLTNFDNTIMMIDDVSFREVKIMIKNEDEFFSSIENINYSKINPTKYATKINATNPLLIALSETYNPSWICYVNGEKILSTQLYGAINCFWINQTGLLEVVIEYEPQRWFFYGSIISVATLLACLTYLTYNGTKNKAFWKRICARARNLSRN